VTAFWSGASDRFTAGTTDAVHWLTEKYGEVAEDVNTRICRMGLPQDPNAAKVADMLRASGFGGMGTEVYKAQARNYVAGLGVSAVQVQQSLAAIKRFEWFDGVENAELSALMLKMYLDGKADPTVLKRVQVAIDRSDAIDRLVEFVGKEVQKELGTGAGPVTAKQLEQSAQKAMNLARKSKDSGGQGFYFGGEGLQPVVGGVTGLSPFDVKLKQPGFFAGTDTLRYSMRIRVGDTYNFANDRRNKDPVTGLPIETQYSRFRAELARLLQIQEYRQFELTYAAAMCSAPTYGGSWDHMDRGHVFASFMFALETAKLFTGIAWSVELSEREFTLQRSGVNPPAPKDNEVQGGPGRRW
jgi:hypothetical protein